MQLNELIISWLPGDTLTGKLTTFFETFNSEYGWNIKYLGRYRAVGQYLQGLPSSIDIPFYNHDIVKLCRENGIFTNYSDDEITGSWYEKIAGRLINMYDFVTKRPTIADIANNNNGHYFDRPTLKFFGQRRSDFRVYKTENPDIWKTYAIYRIPGTAETGESIAYWQKTAHMSYKKLEKTQ